jgi:RNA polymerase sigma factor (sigma-70 family)
MNSAADLTTVIRHLGAPHGDAAGDPELLDRYAHEHDQAAFATLVRRYGPLVLGVARRQLADRHRAEDVFQATFLALARSATKLGRRPVLANWLYTVALRQARKARARTARSEALEHTATSHPRNTSDPLDEITARELLQVIDDELARLPDRLRLPVLLCCVQGLSREEVAQRLGVSDSVVKGRLERGRRRLAARLAARGLTPSALILAPLAAVTIPADLLARTVEQATAPWAETVSAAVAELATSATPRAFLPGAVLAGCVLAAGIAAGLVGWLGASEGIQPGEPAPPVAAAPPTAPPIPTAAAPDDPLPPGATLRFGTSRYRHPTTIENISLSANGKFAVAHSEMRSNGAVCVYDLATGRAFLTLERKPAGSHVEAVALSADGTTLAIKRNFSVVLHDVATGKEVGKAQYPSANPYSAADLLVFTPDGKHAVVAAADGKSLHLLGFAKGEVLRTFPHDNVVFAIALSPDGRNLVGAGYDREKNVYFARLWEVPSAKPEGVAETGKELRKLMFGNGGIRCAAYSADGKTVALGADGGKELVVKLFDAATGKEQLKIPFPDASSVRSVAFSPDGKTLAASGGSSTRLFDTTTGKEIVKIDRKAIGLRFAPDGKVLVGAVAGTIYRWDTTTGQALIPEGGDSTVAQIEVIAGGKQLVTRGQDGDAHVWEVPSAKPEGVTKTGKRLRQLNVSWQRGLAVSPDGKLVVWPVTDETVKFKVEGEPNTIYYGNRLQMFDLAAGKLIERFGGFEGDADDLRFSADGKKLVTVDHRDARVRFWDVATGKVERSFKAGEKGAPFSVWRSRLSPDGKVLAVAHNPTGRGLFQRHAVKLWDTATGKELHDLAGHWTYLNALAFSPDGKYLVTCSEPLSEFAQKQLQLPADQVFVWEVATGKPVAQLPLGATAGAFVPDGKGLAVAEPDGTITFWDTAKWTVRGVFRGPRERVTVLTFGPDGQLFSGSVDATVTAWDPQIAKPAEPK